MTRRWTAAALALVLGTGLLAGGCSGSGDGDGATEPTTPEVTTPVEPMGSIPPDARTGANPPPIQSYEVPPTVSCTPGETVTVPVTYKTEGAMTVTFLLDMTQVEGQPPLSGSFDIPVPCDGASHGVVLFAIGVDASTNTKTMPVVAGA